MKCLVFIFVIVLSMAAIAGNGGRGGIPEAMTVSAYTRYITGLKLRGSVENYLDTLDTSQITDPVDQDVKKAFEKMKKQGLRDDILAAGTYVVGLENCKQVGDELNPDSTNPKVRAWTHTGQNGVPNIGGKICFDVAGLVADHLARGISLKDAAIEITALTYHEYVHHFQMETSEPARRDAQEATANAVGGYVLRSTEFVPLLEWKNPSKVTQVSNVLQFWEDAFESADSFDITKMKGVKAAYTKAYSTSDPQLTDPLVYLDFTGVPMAGASLFTRENVHLESNLRYLEISAVGFVQRANSTEKDMQVISRRDNGIVTITFRVKGNSILFRRVNQYTATSTTISYGAVDRDKQW
jgi:hypothetical protein